MKSMRAACKASAAKKLGNIRKAYANGGRTGYASGGMIDDEDSPIAPAGLGELGVEGSRAKSRLDKGKTNINIIIAAGGKEKPQVPPVVPPNMPPVPGQPPMPPMDPSAMAGAPQMRNGGRLGYKKGGRVHKQFGGPLGMAQGRFSPRPGLMQRPMPGRGVPMGGPKGIASSGLPAPSNVAPVSNPIAPPAGPMAKPAVSPVAPMTRPSAITDVMASPVSSGAESGDVISSGISSPLAPRMAPAQMAAFKKGGRVKHKDGGKVKHAAGGGLGRLEKIKAYGLKPSKKGD